MDELPLPRLPKEAESELPPSDDQRNQATYLALAALLGVGVGLAFLIAMIFPGLLYFLAALLAIPLYFLFHYVVWGRLMATAQDDSGQH